MKHVIGYAEIIMAHKIVMIDDSTLTRLFQAFQAPDWSSKEACKAAPKNESRSDPMPPKRAPKPHAVQLPPQTPIARPPRRLASVPVNETPPSFPSCTYTLKLHLILDLTSRTFFIVRISFGMSPDICPISEARVSPHPHAK